MSDIIEPDLKPVCAIAFVFQGGNLGFKAYGTPDEITARIQEAQKNKDDYVWFRCVGERNIGDFDECIKISSPHIVMLQVTPDRDFTSRIERAGVRPIIKPS